MQSLASLSRSFMAIAMLTSATVASPAGAQGPDWPRIDALKWVDSGYLTRQRATIDEIARGEYGRLLRGDKSDLNVLQRIIDDELIKPVETQKMQALGVVLGDVFVNEFKLEWRTYEDPEGKSRAVCLPDNRECLFPITMISKRLEYGNKPKVAELFERGHQHMKPYLPKLPYSAR